MRLPPGHEQPGHCAHLKRSIYGLKQSPRQWYGRLTAFLIPLGYKPTNFDPCVLVHKTHEIIIAIYVDGITIFGSSPFRHTLKGSLQNEFDLSDLGSLNWLLGIQIEWGQKSVTLSQQAYIDQLLVKFGMDTCNPVILPLNPNQRLVKAEEGNDLADVSLYQQIIRSIMYLVIGTAGYADADYAGDRSDSGYIFQFAANTICWRAVKQRCTATSTVEAEYIALSTAAKHYMWLQHALGELRVRVPTALSTDNGGSIDLTTNPRISGRSKHIDVAYHHVRDLAESGKLTVLYIPSHDNLADLCTKPLPSPRLSMLRDSVLGTGECIKIHLVARQGNNPHQYSFTYFYFFYHYYGFYRFFNEADSAIR